MLKASPQKNTLLQVAQANAETKTCKRVFFSSAQEKLKNKKFPSLQKNKTSQPHSTTLTQTSIEWWTALEKVYRKLTRYHFGQTEAHAGNTGLKEMAGTVRNQTFVHLINFVAWDSDEHLIRHFFKPRTVVRHAKSDIVTIDNFKL